MKNFFDAHVHAFPNKLFKAIWDFFEDNYWRIEYKYFADEIVDFMARSGCAGFTCLNYAHKPSISRELNTWTHQFASEHENVVPFGTIHPGDPYFENELDRALHPRQLDLKGLKLQLLVTDFDPGIRRLDIMYETLVQHGKILVMHAGTGPGANEHVGIRKIRPVLERYPNLKVQFPHLGCFEFKEFFDLAGDFPSVYFDTAMILVQHGLFDDGFKDTLLLDDMLRIKNRIMFGSDFPNIPYSYQKAVESIERLPVGDDVKRAIYFDNAVRFYGLDTRKLSMKHGD